MNITQKSRVNYGAEVNDEDAQLLRPVLCMANHANKRKLKKIGASLLFTFLALIFGSLTLSAQPFIAFPNTLDFGNVLGNTYSSIAPQPLSIQNNTTSNIDVNISPMTLSDYDLFPPISNPITVQIGGPISSFQVNPKGNLGFGDHNETITFDNNGYFVNVDLKFRVRAIGFDIEPPTSLSFSQASAGYAPITPINVNIKNVDTNPHTLDALVSQYYELGAGAPTSITSMSPVPVKPKQNLTVGTYNETLWFKFSNGDSISVDASFTVVAAPTASSGNDSIEVSPRTESFGSVPVNYTTPPNAKSFTVKNVGTTTINSTDLIFNHAPSFVLTLPTTNIAPNRTASFSVQPSAGMGIGVYRDTIRITTSNNGKDSIIVDFSVDSYIISANVDTLKFGSAQVSYSSPTAQTVLIKNDGTGQITLTQPQNTAHFEIGTLSKTTLKAGDGVTFNVKPLTGLQKGTYQDSIIIKGNNNASDTVYFQFTVTEPQTYTISLTPNSLSFVDTLGNANQLPYDSIIIKNTGTDIVELTRPSNTNYSFIFSHYLSNYNTIIIPDSTVTLIVQPNANYVTNRALGTYNDQISIIGNNGIKEIVNVTYNVVKPKYLVEVTTNSLSSSQLVFGAVSSTTYTPPAAKQIIIKNNGSDPVTLNALNFSGSGSQDYNIDTIGVLPKHIAPGANVTFNIQPKSGLGDGSYNATINAEIDEMPNFTHYIYANFDVNSSQQSASFSVSSSSIQFDSFHEPYTPPAAETLTIVNNGTDTLALALTPSTSSSFDISALSKSSIVPGEMATFTVRPKAGLLSSASPFNEQITITGTSTSATPPTPNNNTASVNVDFGVAPALTYTIQADVAQLQFGALAEPYTQPAVQHVTIENMGTADISLTPPSTSTNDFDISALSHVYLSGQGATSTFTVQPQAGLSPGLHKDKIVVSGNNGVKVEIPVEFTVTKYSINASPLTSFGSVLATGGTGAASTASKRVTITNNGTDTVWLAAPPALSDYSIAGWNGGEKLIPGATLNFDVTMIQANLPVGSYTELITIECKDASNNTISGVFATVTADFTVASVSTVSIEVLPQVIMFGQLQVPYALPAAQAITITNNGTEDIVSLTRSINGAVSSYNIGALPSFTQASPLTSGNTATFNLQPKANLPAGTYNIDITISGNSGGASVTTIPVTFKVDPATPPTVTTDSATNISQTSAKIHKVVTKGTETITEQGFEYRIAGAPDWTKLTSVATSAVLTNLKVNRPYQFRAYAKTASGVTYSVMRTFRTLAGSNVPVPENDQCMTATSLHCGASWIGTTDGATEKANIDYVASHYGVWYVFKGDGEKTTITSEAKPGLDHKMVIYTGTCNNLIYLADKDDAGYGETETYTFITVDSTTYYVYIAHNNASGNSLETGDFSISRTCYNYPSVTTLEATDITSTSATLNMLVTPGWSTIISKVFWYRVALTNDWRTSVDGTLTGLMPETQYDFYASILTAPNNYYYGATLSFTTLGDNANDFIRSNKVVVYPNPAVDRLTIEYGSAEIENATAEIYDMFGRRVISHKLSDGNTVNVSNLSSGLYLIKIGNSASKFIKE